MAVLVTVMMAKPCHGEGQAIFITACGNIVQIVVRVDCALAPASVGGIRVEDLAIPIFVKDADARSFRTGKFGEFAVVFDFAAADLVRCEGNVVVVIEVSVVGRNPTKLPAKSLLKGIDP